jgi:pimeloyl-[acyl-carrier protein] methyl ester esterase
MKKLFFQTFGKGYDIVLLHGWGLHSGVWQFVVAKLAEAFRVTIIDLPGFGRSDAISDYSLENIVNLLQDVAPAKAIWLGWSLGGLIATKLALLFPERVSKLICVASSPRFLKTERWPGMEASVLQKFNKQLAVDYDATLMRFLLLQFYGMAVNKELIKWLSLNLSLHGKPSLQTLNASLNILVKEDLRAEITHLNCPMRYILGKRDALVPAELGKILPTGGPLISAAIIPQAGHALFLSHENEFLTEVKRFSSE